MSDINNPLIAALRPLTSRVRTDVTAIRVEDGSSRWSRRKLTDEVMAAHLNGGPGRGVSPIRAGESVTMVGLLDLDSHKGEVPWARMTLIAAQLMASLQLVHGCEPLAFRSSGGRGIHVYCLWELPQDAYSVRMMLRDVVEGCGWRSGAGGIVKQQIEIFPKQDSVAEDGFGNQFILPFAGASELLADEPLSGGLVGVGRVAPDWTFSADVDVREKPPAPERPEVPVLPEGEVPLWRQALDALSNSGERELDYDDWWAVLAGIHYETGGSAEGFAIAMAWSMRSTKHDQDFFENRVWPYLGREGGRGVAGGTIQKIATEVEGWKRPIIPLEALADPDEGLDPEADGRLAAPTQTVQRRGVPQAKHLCTDLANANRLVAAYGASILVADSRWYVWNGRVWDANEADLYRFAGKLSAIIRQEAKDIVERAQRASGDDGAPAVDRVTEARKLAEALMKWSSKSEMKGAIEAAIGLARKMLTVPESALDSHKHLLNCRNGVVDLRTGELLPHDPALLMTKLADVDYVEGADVREWEQVVLDITRDKAVAAFLRRWFGYCATAEVNEQAFVVHWGDGGNGKSTVMGTVARVLGTYAGSAAPGLVASTRATERHPTELADLFGRRMVTAHETGDGATLTEDVVKKITGDDIIKARRMREDFFDFTPTHKLQLLTNSKPMIKGQDRGIWRRVFLVPYTATFGTAEEVAQGRATAVRDRRVTERLATEAGLQAVLAWVVAGAREWYAAGALHAPAAVLEASEAYRKSQDRVSQFIDETCELGEELSEPLTLGSLGLYPAYERWCKSAGVGALSRQRFVDEVRRARPAVRVEEVYRKVSTAEGKDARRKVTLVNGLSLVE